MEESWVGGILSPDVLASSRNAKRTVPTLEEFHKQHGSPRNIRINANFPPHVRDRLRAQRLWQVAYDDVYQGYNVDQLLGLSRQAKLPTRTKRKSKPKKADLVSALLRKELKLSNPDDKPTPPEAAFRHSIPVSRTTLFLLLADRGSNMARLSVKHPGVDLRPERKMPKADKNAAGQKQPRPAFFLVATGDKSVINDQLVPAVEEFVRTIRSVAHPLEVPVDDLDADVVQYISQQTLCAIASEPNPSAGTSSRAHLRLASTSWDNIARAQALLASMQARHFKPTPALLSAATPSPLDADFVEDPNSDLSLYSFLPSIPHSSVLWSMRLTLGDRVTSSFFRLARIRRAAWSQRGAEPALKGDVLGLADLDDPNEVLGTPRNWARVEEKTGLQDTLPLGILQREVTHSLHFGQLLFPGRSTLADTAAPESQVLQQVFGAPLGGSWTLDTAYEWFRQQQEGNATRSKLSSPLWTPMQLPGTAADAVGDHAPALKLWLQQEKAVETESIRLTYWATPQGPSDIKNDEVKRLVIEIREVEEVAPSPELSKNVDTEDSADGEFSDDLGDLLGNPADVSSDPSSSARDTVRTFKYDLESAHWSTVKQADIFMPDHAVDLRAQTERTAQIEETGDLTAALRVYLSLLAQNASKPASNAQGAAAAQHQTHPKTAQRPAPLDTSPPLSFDVAGMHCRFESAERVYSSRWALDLELGQDVSANVDDKSENASDDSTSDKATEVIDTPRRVTLVNETTMGGETVEASRTSSRIEWAPQQSGDRGRHCTWEERFKSVRGLLRNVVIGP